MSNVSEDVLYKTEEYIAANHITQEEFARRSGLSQSYISKMLLKRVDPGIKGLRGISKVLNIGMSELLKKGGK